MKYCHPYPTAPKNVAHFRACHAKTFHFLNFLGYSLIHGVLEGLYSWTLLINVKRSLSRGFKIPGFILVACFVWFSLSLRACLSSGGAILDVEGMPYLLGVLSFQCFGLVLKFL